MELKNRTLSNFAELVESGECKKFRGRLKVGVDLGTANTVLAVVDTNNRPIAGISAPSHAIQDGVIVNYYESVQLVTKLKAELEERLGVELPYAAAAIPPGVSEGSVKSIGYVLEGAGFEVTNIVDEPTAAAAVLKITDGAVVDVGGGTTGISILKDGKVIYTDDEATGGSHMTMTVAGHYRIPYEEAEVLKTTPEKEDEIFPRKNGYNHREIPPRISGSGCLCRWRFCKLSQIHHCIRKETWSSGLPPGSSASRNTTRHRILLRPATGNT